MFAQYSNIFSSYITLSFSNKNIQSRYLNRNKPKLQRYNKISFSLLLLLSLIINTILIIRHPSKTIQYQPKQKIFYIILIVLSSLSSILNIIFLVFSFLRRFTSSKMRITLSCISYCFITIEFTMLKILIEVIYQTNWQDYFFLNIIDYLVRIMIHFFGLIDFMHSIIINVILTGLILALYYAVDTVNSIICDSGATFIILNLGLVVCTYCITKKDKNRFFYLCEIQDLMLKQNAILDNLNTGYLRIKQGKIEVINAALIETLKNVKAINQMYNCNVTNTNANITQSSSAGECNDITGEWLYKNKDAVIGVLFGGLSLSNVNGSDVICGGGGNGNRKEELFDNNNNINNNINIITDTTVTDPLIELSEHYMKKINKCKHRCSGNNNNNLTTNTKHNDNDDNNNKVNNSSNSCNSSSPCSELHFIFLAYQTLILTTGQNVNYEISFKCQNQNEFEFIFNDITRTKESEQKEYDIKIKNVFLTKIAHEFKNPLVSISELLSQIKDQHIQVANKCDIGTSLCEYLLLLIKDLDFFALDSKTNLYSGFTKEKINIKSLAHFCVEMGTRRLNLLQKDKDVTITCTIDDDCPNEIISDDGKVKQVLLNLITNATKFTKKGSITLHIRKEDEEYIQFVIKDTGCGIPYKRQQGLMDYKSNNNIGTEGGIGLTIVKELTSLLGKEIEFQSEENKGSTFWFSLPINNNNNNTYINSNSNNNNNNNNILHFSPIRPVHMRISNKDINAILNCTNVNNNTSLLNSSGSTVKVENFDLELNSIHHHVKRSTKEQIHIVVCDDEVLARKALIRVLNETAIQMDMKLNIIEASDGIELLYLIYDNCINGNKQLHISAILSDQTMVFVNGAVCQMILSTMTNVKLDIPFYIVTAYDVNAEYFRDVKLNRVFSKPLRKCDAHVILNELT